LNAETYREYAARCLELAYTTTDERGKFALIDMARAWMRLAEQAEKNSQLDLSYETPPPKKSDE
jgi:hypothetical protein